jgi:signal transduction histidine kinase
MKKRPRAKGKLGRHKVRVTSHRRGSAIPSLEKTIASVARERDELLEQQSATADLLGIINRSKFELRPVLQTVVDTAVRLCRATSGEIFRLDNGVYRFAVGCNLDQEYIERQKPIAPSPGTMVGRTAMTRRVARIDDLLSDPSYLLKEDAKVSGARSMIGVPLMREGEPIGVIILARHRVEPFSEREIKLVTAFADQAVIAIGVRERERQVASQARSAEQALDLLASVSTVANTADDLNALAYDCLVQSAKSARCQFGQLWYPQPGADAVKCFADCYFGDPQFAEFHLSSVKLGLQKEEKSIPGWVWRRRTPIWIEDLAKYLDSLGVEAARAVGFRSALAVPVTIGNDVFAIFEMYSTNAVPVDQTVMAAVVKLGRLLGDILVRRRSELALLTAHAELARVSQLSAMGAMTGSISHEIRQPLAAMVVSANAGLRWLSKSPPDLDEVIKLLKSIVREGQRTSDILESIRAMFKKDSQKDTPVDVNGLIGDVLALIQNEAQKQRVSVQTKLADGLPRVFGNRVQLQQVILNLVINALEAMATTTERDRTLRVKSAAHSPDGVLIAVEDSGAGIDPQNVERIFDALFTTKSNGMGMGLSICRSIIETHHGRLWATVGADYGSVFHIALPSAGIDAENLRASGRDVSK